MAGQGSFGHVLKIMVATTLTEIVNVVDMNYPTLEKVLAESTGHDSTAGYAEFMASGKYMVSEFTVTVVWDSAETTHAAIVTAFDAAAAVSMSIADPDTVETISGSAHVKAVNRQADQEDAYKAEIVFQPTGQWSIA
jgi:hypothetical protein